MSRRTIIILNLVTTLFAASCSSPATEIGIKNGKLAPCPDSPNCVSSYAVDAEHSITAINASGSIDDVMSTLRECINQMRGSTVVKQEGPYLHVEFRSRVFRFVDDLEFLYDQEKSRIEIRSAARRGYTDFSVNRKRLEIIRKEFAANTN